MTTEICNWAVVAASMEAQGATNSQMYIRAKALADGKSDPMPTSFPAAPFSILLFETEANLGLTNHQAFPSHTSHDKSPSFG